MPKLPVLKPKKLIKILESEQFLFRSQKGSHAHFVHADGRRTTVPIHSKDVPNGTLLAIINDMRISKEEFVKLMKKK